MSLSLKHLSLLSFVLLPALAACDSQVQASAQQPPQRPPEVEVVTVKRHAAPVTVELPGRTSAFRVAEVRPQVTGIIKQRLFEEGSTVAAGQKLYQIDAAPYEASLASARAELQMAETALSAAQTKVDRYSKLVAVEAVSRQNYDDAQTALAQSQAQVALAQAAVDAAEINLAYTSVNSPIAGRIGKSAVTEGALVTANQPTSLSVVQQLDPIYVDMSQSAADLIRMRKAIADGELVSRSEHAPVTLYLGKEPYGITGRLTFSDITVDQGTGTVALRAVFPNQDEILMPGLFVKARVEQGVREDAVVVPQQGVTRGPDGKPMVWVVDSDGTVAPRPVTTVQAVGDSWIVSDGLDGGEQIVVAGFQKIKPGIQVTPVPRSPDVAASAASGASTLR